MNPFFRVDNSLVHWQIIATWMPKLRLERIVVVHGEPLNPLQKSMFRMAIPADLCFDAFDLTDGARWLAQRAYGQDRTMVLIRTVSDAERLFSCGCLFSELNIGNVHHAKDSVRVTNAVFLSPEDRRLIESLRSRGVRIEVRSLPNEPPIELGGEGR